MSYKLNKRSLAIARLMERGKNGEARLKYVHASPKGTTVITPVVVARVSLPDDGNQPSVPVIYPQDVVDEVMREPLTDELRPMPEGLPAVTSPDHLVPQLDKLFIEPKEQVASFTCNAELLLKILKAACEVSKDDEKTIRLRICPSKGSLRIDTYRQPGDQEMCAILKEIEYIGNYIPGEKKEGEVPTGEVKPVQATIGLTANAGRKFRG